MINKTGLIMISILLLCSCSTIQNKPQINPSEIPRVWFKVAKVRIAMNNGKTYHGFIQILNKVYNPNHSIKILDDFQQGTNILPLFTKYAPDSSIIFVKNLYEIPAVDQAFALEELEKILPIEIKSITFTEWEKLEGFNQVYILPINEINKGIKAVKDGYKPLNFIEGDIIKHSYILVNPAINQKELMEKLNIMFDYKNKQPKENLWKYLEELIKNGDLLHYARPISDA